MLQSRLGAATRLDDQAVNRKRSPFGLRGARNFVF